MCQCKVKTRIRIFQVHSEGGVQKVPKLSSREAVPKSPREWHERSVFVHLGELEAKMKVARPGHKVVAKDMGQKRKVIAGRSNVYKRMSPTMAARDKCAGKGLIPAATGINIIDGVASPKWG